MQKSLGGTSSIQFGANGDIPTVNDFDGDGNADIAIWRPSNGDWYIIKSTSNQVDRINFGLTGDIPVAADYDGDTKADIAIFRPTDDTWYQKLSTQGNAQQVFGLNNDRPTPGAYNP